MKKKQWKHKITSGTTGVVLSAIMLVGFGALAIWMYKTQNDAIVIGRIVVIFAAVAFVLALYRALFFKVFIGKDGFFYQTNLVNGKYYNYYEIKEAWVSSGRETNSNEMSYCNFETSAGNVTRFFFTGADTDAVEYFLKRVKKVQAMPFEQCEKKKEYKVSGKEQGIQKIVVILFIMIILCLLMKSVMQEGLLVEALILPFLLALIAIVYVIVQYYFYRIDIKENEFFCQTNPFNGRTYRYSEISNCEIVEIRKRVGSIYRPRRRKTYYLYYIVFTDLIGKERKIRFEKPLFEYEINVLKNRIENSRKEL